jgi:uncharacterized membrane protein YbhN (UPF0104 family)
MDILSILAVLLLTAEIGYDGFTTKYILGKGGTENNPVARWLQKYLGVWGTCAAGWAASTASLFLSHWIIWIVLIAEGINCVNQRKNYNAAKGV